jgi:hypothetical protein
LDLFHNESEEKRRVQNKAFIPSSNENLLGLSRINKNMLKFLQINKPDIVTNMNWEGEELIHWSRKRCGYSEHVHSEMKDALCGGQLPSGKFGCNAAWWGMMILSLNIASMMKKLGLPDRHLGIGLNSRMKRIRFCLINIPGRVILEGKELIVRLTRDNPKMDLLVRIKRQINLLNAIASG